MLKEEIADKINIEENIKFLEKEFLRIRDCGYIATIRNGSTGIGATFENLLGKTEDKLEFPDFKGIEIKTRRAYSKSAISLFNAATKGKTDCETKRIRDKYGYPDKLDRKLKRFAAKIGANEIVKVGLFYRFKLRVDRSNEKVILEVYDWNNICIDESTYWDFSILKEKLIRKLSILALIKAWTNKINGIEHFKYYKMNIYILKDFNYFIDALEEGKIKVSFKIGNHYEKDRYGDVQAHGVSFCISDNDLDKIFDIYR